jgi:hypothetical protein
MPEEKMAMAGISGIMEETREEKQGRMFFKAVKKKGEMNIG